MRVVHESAAGGRRTLATEVETADSLVEQTRGLMFRDSLPHDYALVFRFEPGPVERVLAALPAPLDRLAERARSRNVHMLFVSVPLDVVWVDGGEVVQVKTLAPWRGTGGAPADAVVELPAGAADGVEPGDRVLLEESGRPGATVSPPSWRDRPGRRWERGQDRPPRCSSPAPRRGTRRSRHR